MDALDRPAAFYSAAAKAAVAAEAAEEAEAAVAAAEAAVATEVVGAAVLDRPDIAHRQSAASRLLGERGRQQSAQSHASQCEPDAV